MALKNKFESSGGTRLEAELEKEYSARTETLRNLERRAEQLRRDNEFLQNEASQTQKESLEYMTFVSKQTQKRQNIMVTLSDQTQRELQELRRQRVETLRKYMEQTNYLKQEILDKENKLALLNLEIAKLGEIKVKKKKSSTNKLKQAHHSIVTGTRTSLQQQQLECIAGLEQEIAATLHLHAESLQDLKSGFFMEKEKYKTKTKHKAQILNLNMEGSLQSFIHELYQENQHLREELLQLIQKTQTLRSCQMKLLTQWRETAAHLQNTKFSDHELSFT